MGYIQINDKIKLFYEEYGKGEDVIMSAQIGFYPKGMQQRMAEPPASIVLTAASSVLIGLYSPTALIASMPM